MATRHVSNPTDKDIGIGLHCGEAGYVVALNRLTRVAHLSREFEPFGTIATTELSFDDVLKLFPNGIYFAGTE